MGQTAILDGHNDTITFLQSRGERAFVRTDTGQVDITRAKAGGMVGGFFGICVPAHPSSPEADFFFGVSIDENGYDVSQRSAIEHSYAKEFTDAAIGYAAMLEQTSQGQAKIVQNYAQLQQCAKDNILSMVLHLEGAEAIDVHLSNLECYYEQGVRSLGLVWSRPNAFGAGVPFRHPSSPNIGPGLTESGKELVLACNELGIIVDLAHVNEKGFWDAAKISKKPLVVSHAGVHTLCPASRNLTDAQIDAVGASDGVIGVIFEPSMIKFKMTSEKAPDNNIGLMEIVRHIDYIVDRIGIEHVAFGSDFDGAEMPTELVDVAGIGKLIDTLKTRGYDQDAIEKIACGNWLQVIRQSWKT